MASAYDFVRQVPTPRLYPVMTSQPWSRLQNAALAVLLVGVISAVFAIALTTAPGWT